MKTTSADALDVLTAAADAMKTIASLRAAFKIPGEVSTLDFFQAYEGPTCTPEEVCITPVVAGPLKPTALPKKPSRKHSPPKAPRIKEKSAAYSVTTVALPANQTEAQRYAQMMAAPVKPWPSDKLVGFPCRTCKFGKVNKHSDSGFECAQSCGMACHPYGPAWNHEAKG